MGTCQIHDDLVPNLQHNQAVLAQKSLCLFDFPTPRANPSIYKYMSHLFSPYSALHPHCDVSASWHYVTYPLGHLFCLFTGTAPVSLENILPPCSRWLIPALLTTKAQDFITHTGQGRYLCFSLCSLPLKQGRLGLLARQSIEPLRAAMEPPTFKFSPSFYLGFLISSSGD